MWWLHANLHRWLVDHPSITTFQWTSGHTIGATPTFLISAIIGYLLLTLLLTLLIPPKTPILPPPLLKSISAVHNLTLLLLSLIMAVGCTLSAISALPAPSHLFCLPTPTPPRGPLFFWAYVFYLSKLLEFSDTLLTVINPNKRLTFLHVYHHSTVVVMCYVWLEASQSLFPVALATNAGVHTVMYGYYFLSSVGRRPRWKRAVTDLQILQFVFSFGCSVLLLWYEFGEARRCSGMLGWCFNALFNASLLGLFVNFHLKSYGGRRREAEVEGKKGR